MLGSAAMYVGGSMACKVCASDNLQEFPGEMNVSFPGINRVSSTYHLCLLAIIGVLGLRDMQRLSFHQTNWGDSNEVSIQSVQKVRSLRPPIFQWSNVCGTLRFSCRGQELPTPMPR